MSDPKRYGFPMCECDATDEFHMQEMGMAELKDGGFVLWNDYARLKAEVEALKLGSLLTAVDVLAFIRLKDEVERLRKAVMHSPAAQLKLKELEGKTTYEEINAAKDGNDAE